MGKPHRQHRVDSGFFKGAMATGSLIAAGVVISDIMLRRPVDILLVLIILQGLVVILAELKSPGHFLVYFSGTFTVSLILAIQVITQERGELALAWMYLLPPLAFLFLGSRWGLIWSVVVMLFVFSAPYLIPSVRPETANNSSLFFRQILSSMLALFALIFIYQRQQEKQDRQLEIDRLKLRMYNRKLRREIIQNREAEAARLQALAEVETNNATLEKTKLATINVLEDLQSERLKLEESNAKQEALLTSIADGVVAIDPGGKIVFVNQAAVAMLGYSSNEMLGKVWMKDLPEVTDEKGEKSATMSEGSLMENANSTRRFYYKTKDGRLFPAAVSAAPIILAGEKNVGAIVVFRDISDETRIDKAKTEFVSLASHQLRTPLSTINWYAELLQDEAMEKLDKEQVDYLNEIRKGSSRMAELVNSLLNVSRIELGTFAIDPQPTDIKELIQEEIKAVTQMVESRKQKITYNFEEEISENILLDSKLMGIVVENLLTNAAKYTPDGGKIEVNLTAISGEELQKKIPPRFIASQNNKFSYSNNNVVLKPKENYVLINVTDNGLGIPDADQEHIFDKLFRASNVTVTDVQGTGLGLYIVQAIVKASEGFIWFESKQSKGTKFYVALPESGMKKQTGTKKLE